VSYPRPSSRPWLTLLAFAALLFGACSGTTASASPSAIPTPAATASSAVITAPPATASPTPVPAFPADLTDDEGTAVTIAAEPQKIVSLTPANTEILFAIGAGERIVATDDGSDYPAEAAPLPDVATFASVDVEKVVSLDADLVIAGGLGFTQADAITQLRSLGIPVLVVYAPSVDGVYKDIELIGAAVGDTDEATALTDGMRTQMQTISDAASAAATAAGAKPRVFYDVGYTDETGQIYGPAQGSFLAEMVGLLGVDVITSDPTTYEISLETLIEKDPQVILVGVNAFYSPTAAVIAKRNGWKVLTAVKNGDIRPVHDTEITRPGPRLPIGLRNLALAMYPDLVLPAS
jgi:iron complex transport system substrate-binding protein